MQREGCKKKGGGGILSFGNLFPSKGTKLRGKFGKIPYLSSFFVHPSVTTDIMIALNPVCWSMNANQESWMGTRWDTSPRLAWVLLPLNQQKNLYSTLVPHKIRKPETKCSLGGLGFTQGKENYFFFTVLYQISYEFALLSLIFGSVQKKKIKIKFALILWDFCSMLYFHWSLSQVKQIQDLFQCMAWYAEGRI